MNTGVPPCVSRGQDPSPTTCAAFVGCQRGSQGLFWLVLVSMVAYVLVR